MDLPQGWIEKLSSKTGKTYYFNTNTGQSQWEPPSNEAQESVRVRHILQKHAGSRRPASWRCPNVTQSKDEAMAIIRGFKTQIEEALNNNDFQKAESLFISIAQTESDCSSAERGGDLGSFTKGKMQKAFEDASFALERGKVGPGRCRQGIQGDLSRGENPGQRAQAAAICVLPHGLQFDRPNRRRVAVRAYFS